MITQAELLSSNDAQVWAKAFVEAKERNNWALEDIDEELMIGWFANAMLSHEQVLIKDRLDDIISQSIEIWFDPEIGLFLNQLDDYK